MLNTKSTKTGVLTKVKTHLDRNRLGELLVDSGQISEMQLSDALRIQKASGLALGEVLKEQGLISGGALRATLAQQVAWRAMAATLAFVIGFGALGIHTARATSAVGDAGSISRPEGARLQQASINRRDIPAPAPHYQSLFGTQEIRSADVSPFTKWTGVMARLNDTTAALPDALKSERGASEEEKIEAVNAFYNKVRYIEDKNNWGTSDYWETPQEFISRGGDCEDFAIAKYAALKSLGFSEDQLRLAIVRDTWKGIPHAILIVYTADGAKFLDNQYREVKQVAGFDRYQPVYSINRTGWWRHV
ncbi:MAG: transglutaminase-like cysteine peptidase [Rhodospirillales bacterium]|nr:transglutaminase-like cysteine peptidase [Alphaproteobacteria bacterium]MCB9986455.1 transglutaminase-like cysteine peptidase [Rhodospirillales bacterium]USO06999.1 MAG: transglutaminase-like cysteine peptidase [Rhodospirillales bacterium]